MTGRPPGSARRTPGRRLRAGGERAPTSFPCVPWMRGQPRRRTGLGSGGRPRPGSARRARTRIRTRPGTAPAAPSGAPRSAARSRTRTRPPARGGRPSRQWSGKRSRAGVPLADRCAQRVAQAEDLAVALVEQRLELADTRLQLKRALPGAVGLLQDRAGLEGELVLEHGELRVLALDLRAEVQQLDAQGRDRRLVLGRVVLRLASGLCGDHFLDLRLDVGVLAVVDELL